jgi:hypothetical protein
MCFHTVFCNTHIQGVITVMLPVADGTVVVPVGTTPEPEDSGRATERSLCMVKWIYLLVG